MAEKKGGCVSQGCGIIVAGFILLLAIGFISGLFSDDATPDTTSQERTTATPTETVTLPPAEVEPTKPSAPEETPIKPSTTDNVSIELSETIEKVPEPDEFITRSYAWEYHGEWSWDVRIPEVLYGYYKGVPRAPTMDYSVYVTHPLDDIYIDSLVTRIREAASRKGYDEYQTIEFTIAFVQSLPYTVDSVTSPFDEYPRYPVETLVDGGGDCEDTSILLASLLADMG